jgi:serine phosphatase RsbU (regulator of sigma subunit)
MTNRVVASPGRGHALRQSPAFREASLRSEVRRAYTMIGVVVLVLIFILMRESRNLDPRVQAAGITGLSGLFALQLGVLIYARWASGNARPIPTWFIIVTAVIEILIPTGMMATHITLAALSPYASLSSPPLIAYGLLIGLNTLRLRPWLCVIVGAVGAASYLALYLYVAYGMDSVPGPTDLPREAFATNAMLILISGVAAAWGAREIRGHAEAALAEAETRRQMDRIERDLDVARSIQQALLPKSVPDIPGFEIAGWNRPAEQTGGDYFDWQRLPDGKWIVTVADVSGHGIGPALVTAACRAYVRASSSHEGNLESLTGRINQLLAQDLPDGRFVTMASVLISAADQPVALLSAGHGPIVLYVGRSGDVHDIMPGDLPLAVNAEERFGPAQVISLGPGDVLALVTDGFTEWARTDEGRRHAFGIDRLRDSFKRNAHLGAGAMIDAITSDVAAFTHPAPQQDDLTMVIIRRIG